MNRDDIFMALCEILTEEYQDKPTELKSKVWSKIKQFDNDGILRSPLALAGQNKVLVLLGAATILNSLHPELFKQ